MLVDPNTGMPIGDPTPSANSLGGQIGMNALGSAGLTNQEVPLAFDLLSSVPTATTTTMWNMGRTARTITHGGRRFGTGGRGVRTTFNPLNFRKLPDASMIEPLDFMQRKKRGTGGYTPFNFLAENANKMMAWDTSRGKIRRSIGQRLINQVPEFMRPGTGEYAFSPGTLGRVSAMGRTYGLNSGAKNFAKRQANILTSFTDINPDMSHWATRGMNTSTFGTTQLGESIALSARGTISQSALSYIHGASSARAGRTLADTTRLSFNAMTSTTDDGIRMAANRSFKASVKGFEHYGAGGFKGAFAKGASFAPAASSFLGTAGWILLAGDMIKMGAKVMNRAAQTALEAGTSVKGSITKPAFGMGFKDNTVAATARQRGVLAISNSQLNARSVLGVEAAGLHSHFG